MHGVDGPTWAYGLWTAVVISVGLILFLVFSYMKPQKRFEWRSMGLFTGFIVALFTEMYGIPLTIYLLLGWFGTSYPVENPFSHANGHLILVVTGWSDSAVAMTLLHLFTNGLVFLGIWMIYRGWKQIHDAGDDELITNGIYAYLRHPQYTGLFLITVGLLIQWPTLITLLLWPALMIVYYRLVLREDRELEQRFGDDFRRYRESVPAFVPGF